jgi:hypothetical protein
MEIGDDSECKKKEIFFLIPLGVGRVSHRE